MKPTRSRVGLIKFMFQGNLNLLENGLIIGSSTKHSVFAR